MASTEENNQSAENAEETAVVAGAAESSDGQPEAAVEAAAEGETAEAEAVETAEADAPALQGDAADEETDTAEAAEDSDAFTAAHADRILEEGGELDWEQFAQLIDQSMHNLAEGEIVEGHVIAINSDTIVVDVGYKSEGLIAAQEFKNRDGELQIAVGDSVEVLLEKTEDVEGHVLLSHQKAKRMRRWNEIQAAFEEGTIINGRVVDRIKGGLTVDVGLRAFLPGSLVDIRPVKNLESLKGEELEFKVISLDRRRNNIVLSRKAVLEKEFAKKKEETLTRLRPDARIQGVVKNITDYGVFIDLGGIDGLLHITDISWGRVNHPSEHFSVGDEVGVVVLKFDPDTERVSLGYKQKSEDPWTLVDKKYPIGSRVRGRVVSIVDYGAFVEIEEGVEGLVHVSEMSWTKKVVNPSKIVNVEDQVEAIVSELDMDQRRISLSLRQTERNPWEELADTFPEGSIIEGKVRNLTDFGAFVEITEGIDGLIHVSDMSWTKRVKHPSEVLKKGESVKARITNIDVANQRVSLSIKEFMPNEWQDFVDSHNVGDIVEGQIVNVTDFGLFVDIYEGLEGLVHISETDVSANKLADFFSTGEWVRSRILRIEESEKKVGLTMRGVPQPTAEEIAELETANAPEEAEEEEGAEAAAEGSEESEAVAADAEASDADSSDAGASDDTSDAEAVEAEAADADASEAEAADASEAEATEADEAAEAAPEAGSADEASAEEASAEEASAEESADDKSDED
ncbi:MAG: 30S ribosomal protein S1 [Acidobacteriota bacterium]